MNIHLWAILIFTIPIFRLKKPPGTNPSHGRAVWLGERRGANSVWSMGVGFLLHFFHFFLAKACANHQWITHSSFFSNRCDMFDYMYPVEYPNYVPNQWLLSINHHFYVYRLYQYYMPTFLVIKTMLKQQMLTALDNSFSLFRHAQSLEQNLWTTLNYHILGFPPRKKILLFLVWTGWLEPRWRASDKTWNSSSLQQLGEVVVDGRWSFR